MFVAGCKESIFVVDTTNKIKCNHRLNILIDKKTGNIHEVISTLKFPNCLWSINTRQL